MAVVPLGPVPTTDEKNPVRQNTAIQQLFGAFTASLQSLAALSTAAVTTLISVSTATGIDGTGNVILAPASTGTGNAVRATSPSLITPALGAATGTSLAATGAITSSGGGVGYATGAGGTIVQATNKSTGVTLNTLSGAITMNAATLNAGTYAFFTLINSFIAATDLVLLSNGSPASAGFSGKYTFTVADIQAGTVDIAVLNNGATNLSEAVVIRFAVIKAVNS